MKKDIYSGVVGMDSVWLGFTLRDLNQLKCVAGYVGNAYLNEYTKEKI